MTMQRTYFSILFFIRRTRLLKNGEAPIGLRITMNGRRAELQLGRSVDAGRWNAQRGCAVGKDRKTLELNQYLEVVRTKIYQFYRELMEADRPITAEMLKRLYSGEGDTPKMLLEVFREHNRKYRELLGKDYVKGTVLRYERTVRYLEELLQTKYNRTDIPLREITPAFVLEFEHFIKASKGCAQNATVKYLKNLKKIIRLALTNKWMSDDPFQEMRFHQTQSNRDFLTEEDLKQLLVKTFDVPRLEVVRDIFAFCSLTGLAFTDVQHLTPAHISQDDTGCYWIRKSREKTNNMCNIPLLDIPRMLVEKYSSHPECVRKGVVFPVPSNQKMNAYLKEIADVCGIKKSVSSHQARHTFACVALANKVSMESIAKMLGHSDIRTTKIYAKLMDKTVSEEMDVLRQKFSLCHEES